MSKLSMLFAGLAFLALFWETRGAGDAVLEIVAVIDKPAHDKWKSLAKTEKQFKKEVYSTIVEVNEVFKSLSDNGVNLEIRVQDVLTPKRNVMGTKSTGHVEADLAMQKVQKWVKKHVSDFDHVVVFIDADLTYNSGSISSYSMSGGTCQEYGITIVKANYDYRTATSLVTSLAQSFSVSYDGQGDAKDCDPNDGFVMTSILGNSKSSNRWTFSSCSAEQIKSYVSSDRRSCLFETTAPSLSAHKRFGEVVGGEETCKRETGKSMLEGQNPDICEKLYCLDKVVGFTTHMKVVDTPEGMSCGGDKKCIKGECVSPP